MVKVAVLGAGVNGLTCAMRIKEKYKNVDVSKIVETKEVTLISQDFSPDTTGDGSGGLWLPYLCGSTPSQLLRKWGIETYRHLHKLWLETGYDVSVMPIYNLRRKANNLETPEWSQDVFGYRELDENQLEYFRKALSANLVAVQTFTTFVVLPPTLLRQFHLRFTEAGGRIVRATVKSLTDELLNSYDIIVNCTGLGSRDIVPDPSVFSTRGQIIKVNALWLNAVVMDTDNGHYIIPNPKMCVMGGTHQEHNYNSRVDEGDAEMIRKGCTVMLPTLKHADTLSHWVGLRPCRSEVRLEKEHRDGRIYVHNYGHGGSGFTLFWGCSNDVLDLLEEHLDQDQYRSVPSKL